MWELYRLIEDIKSKQKEIFKEMRNGNKRSLSYNAGRLVILDEVLESAEKKYSIASAEEARRIKAAANAPLQGDK